MAGTINTAARTGLLGDAALSRAASRAGFSRRRGYAGKWRAHARRTDAFTFTLLTFDSRLRVDARAAEIGHTHSITRCAESGARLTARAVADEPRRAVPCVIPLSAVAFAAGDMGKYHCAKAKPDGCCKMRSQVLR